MLFFIPIYCMNLCCATIRIPRDHSATGTRILPQNKRVQEIGIQINVCQVLYLFIPFVFKNIINIFKSKYNGDNSVKQIKRGFPSKKFLSALYMS